MATKVEAEVGGTIWKLVATPGERIEADTPILLVESMKMEIPVVAPRDGVLLSILVAEGDLVAEGQIVAELE